MFDVYKQIQMKRSVNKSSSFSKLKPLSSKSQISTGVNSQQRTQINSLVRQREPKTQLTDTPESTKTVKARQLFAIIETFYSTLCDLPLQKLVSSAEPEVWIQEQEQTLRSLQGRLRKMGKQKEHEYYKCRLHSIETILGNIRQNLAMLKRMSELKNYCSGTESSNCLSQLGSSFDSTAKGVRLGQFASDTASIRQMQEMLNYDEYPISSSQMPKSTVSGCPQMMAHTVNSEVQSSEEDSLTHSQMVRKKKGKRMVAQYDQNHNILNNEISKLTQNKDKTLTKVKNTSKTQATTGERYKGLQTSNEWTKRTETIGEENSSFKLAPFSEYMQLIKELRLQLLEKDKEIQKLLISQQEFEQTVEIFQTRQKQKSTEILFLKQNAAIHERQKEKMQSEIRRLSCQAEQLRETVRLQRNRQKKEEEQRAKLQQRLQTEIEEKNRLSQQLQRLQENSDQWRKSEKQTKQTLQTYTRKYFQLLQTADSLKEQMRLLSEQLARQRQRNAAEEVSDSVRRVIQRHRQKIFPQ